MPLTPLQQRSLQIAKRHIGEKEATGRNDGPAVLFWQRLVAKGYKWLDKQPWCACFATGVVHLAAKDLGITPRLPLDASSSSLYRWAKANGELLLGPTDGCIGLVKAGGAGDHDGRSNAGSSHIHTFLVHTVNPDGSLATIEGNFRNSTCWNKRKPPYGCDFIRIC